MSGIEVLDQIRERFPHIEVILLTGQGTIDTAVAATRRGAFHFLTKPCSPDEVEVTLTETDAHSGIFVGTVLPKVVDAATEIRPGDDILGCMQGDELVVEYVDESHMGTTDAVDVTAKGLLGCALVILQPLGFLS